MGALALLEDRINSTMEAVVRGVMEVEHTIQGAGVSLEGEVVIGTVIEVAMEKGKNNLALCSFYSCFLPFAGCCCVLFFSTGMD